VDWEIAIKHFKNYLQLERSLSENSISAYCEDVNKLKGFIKEYHSEMSPLDVTHDVAVEFITFVGSLGLSAHSQARILSGIKAFYKYQLIEDLVTFSPVELIESPRLGRKIPDVLNLDEINKLLGAIDLSTPEGARNRAMIEMLYGSGLRVSELIGLKLNNLFFEEGFMRIFGKGNKERLVPLGSEAAKFLQTYVNEWRCHVSIKPGNENLVFLNRRGTGISRVMIFKIIKTLIEDVGLKKNVSPHTFRHSFATHLIEGGADLRAVQEMLGHESITTTEVYTHLDKDFLKQTIQEFHPRS